MSKYFKTLLTFNIVLLLYITPGEAGLLRDRATRSTEISTKCYRCSGKAKGYNNVEACSIENGLKIEKCPVEDRFDKCIVFEAFSSNLNSTIFKRECSSARFCTGRNLCSNPDYLNCRFECCNGDLCNDFDFKSDEDLPPNAPPTVVASTTEKVLQNTTKRITILRTEKETISTKPSAKTTTQKPNIESIQTTISDQKQYKESSKPIENYEDCVDIDKMCLSYAANPIYLAQYCEDNKSYMAVNCRKTCKFCHIKAPTGSTTIQHTAPVTKTQECVDTDVKCATYVGDPVHLPMFCEDNKHYTSVVCRKTCKFCGETPTEEMKPTEIITTEVDGDKPPQGVTNTPETRLTTATIEMTNTAKLTSKPTSKSTSKPTLKSSSKPTLKSTSKPTLKPTSKPTLKSTSKPTSKSTSKLDPQPFPTSEDCEDKRRDCSKVAKYPGYCKTHSQLMKELCPKSCGFCSQDLPQEGVTVTSEPAPTLDQIQTPKPTATEDCKDKRENCTTDPLYCRRFLWFTQENCRKSCGFCSKENGTSAQQGVTKAPISTSKPSVELTPEPTSKPSAIATGDCEDKRTQCKKYANYPGYCTYHSQFMKKICPKSCGYCPGENETDGFQGGVPNPSPKFETEGIPQTDSPETKTTSTSIYEGKDLRWISQSWGKCVAGIKSRVVRCYHFYQGEQYHVTINACIKAVGEMPEKQRSC